VHVKWLLRALGRARSRMMEMQSSRYLRLDLRQHLGTSQG
jgi:hypothetical protein